MNGKFSSLSASSLRTRRPIEDEDPTSGLTNLADCMLVLACGLMVALVVAWKVDLTAIEVAETGEKVEISDVDSSNASINGGENNYVELGRVYQDPETGKYYMVEGGE